jgi:hypothetical protein
MSKGKLRAFLAASAFATLGILGCGQAVGQQTKIEIPVPNLFEGPAFSRPSGNIICWPPCTGVSNDPQCCISMLGLKAFAKIDADGKTTIELQGLTAEQSKMLIQQLKKGDAPAPQK